MKKIDLFIQKDIGEYVINPVLQGQVYVAQKTFCHGSFKTYKFTQGHFFIHCRPECLTNEPRFINYNGFTYTLPNLAYEGEGIGLKVLIFDPNDVKDKEVLDELTFYELQEDQKYNI